MSESHRAKLDSGLRMILPFVRADETIPVHVPSPDWNAVHELIAQAEAEGIQVEWFPGAWAELPTFYATPYFLTRMASHPGVNKIEVTAVASIPGSLPQEDHAKLTPRARALYQVEPMDLTEFHIKIRPGKKSTDRLAHLALVESQLSPSFRLIEVSPEQWVIRTQSRRDLQWMANLDWVESIEAGHSWRPGLPNVPRDWSSVMARLNEVLAGKELYVVDGIETLNKVWAPIRKKTEVTDSYWEFKSLSEPDQNGVLRFSLVKHFNDAWGGPPMYDLFIEGEVDLGHLISGEIGMIRIRSARVEEIEIGKIRKP